jgi:hypothetical protein
MLIFFFITDGETKQATALTPRISYMKALMFEGAEFTDSTWPVGIPVW